MEEHDCSCFLRVETGTESYRLARTKAQKNDAAKYTVTTPRSS